MIHITDFSRKNDQGGKSGYPKIKGAGTCSKWSGYTATCSNVSFGCGDCYMKHLQMYSRTLPRASDSTHPVLWKKEGVGMRLLQGVGVGAEASTKCIPKECKNGFLLYRVNDLRSAGGSSSVIDICT